MMTLHTISRTLYILIFCLLWVPSLHAQDDDMMGMNRMGTVPLMPMMGMGQMGGCRMGMMSMMGPMGMGRMGMMGPMGMGPMGMMSMMRGMGMMQYMLDLSGEQRNQMRDIHKDTRSKMWPLRDRMMEYNDDLYELYQQDTPDAGKVGDVYKNIFDIKRQMIELHVKARNRMFDVLTDEQKAQLEQMTSSWMGGYGPRGRRGMGMMPHMMR